jgi:glyoxylase-like metal-dependent hydrolase (beta-lactamase superfamily II)
MAAGWGETMVIQVPVKGYFEENCFFYIDEDTNHGFLIDPGAQADTLLALILERGWVIEKILLTHGHFDHTGAVNEIRRQLQIPVVAYLTADEYLLDPVKNLSGLCGPVITVRDVLYVDDGDRIALETNPDFSLKVIHTPGHTPDSVVYYSMKDHVAFAGDTIFKGSPGTDQFPGGNGRQLLRSICGKLMALPDETVLFTGHSEQTTVGAERRRYQRYIR